ncbi:Esterase/lipase/thioesterase family protein isoform 2 [Hibiscus syriacus]|uniref:Esterase/lipase/thioesterase family protein isoform 2 n=1 Tax=Hibiscus syriacus TaxID=106335 RepID=A0A6A2XP48_HIBSY|nr:Esterase/lipase/thioesterase family protein isoform 2 [Hibiscus syriacus]
MSSSPLSLISKPPPITLLNHQRPPLPTVHVSAATSTTTTAMPDHHPSLEITGGGAELFLPALDSHHLPYKPFPISCSNRHLETIFAAFFRTFPELPPDSPILILLPGLTGGCQDSYVKHMLVKAKSKGWRVVVFNSRGCANSPVTTPQLQTASFTADTCHVVDHVPSMSPEASVYGVGWSLGRNILVNYLGREYHRCSLSGAVSLCNPFDLVIADENLRKGFNNIYDRALREAFLQLFRNGNDEYNVQAGLNPRTVREYDEAITRGHSISLLFKKCFLDDKLKIFNTLQYHRVTNQRMSITRTHVVVMSFNMLGFLCIQAANDPISPIEATPNEDIKVSFKENPNCMLIVTPQGGHLGWLPEMRHPLELPGPIMWQWIFSNIFGTVHRNPKQLEPWRYKAPLERS